MASRNLQASKVANSILDLIKIVQVEVKITHEDAAKMGYYSCKDFSKAAGCSNNTAMRLMRAGYEAGKLERIKVALGSTTSYYYRPLKQGGKTKANSKERK